MSLKLNERYPNRFNNPSSEYPLGSFKNRTAPNAKDGSYLEQDWANDKEGFFQSLLSAAGIDANGSVDKVGASQFYDALIDIISNSVSTPQATEAILGGGKIATQTLTNNGVDDSTIVTPKKLGVKVTDAIATTLGYNQTFQDMTASRAKNVTYTNSTGRPIQLFIRFDPDGSSSVLKITGHTFNLPDKDSEFISAIIPDGGTYSLSAWGTASIMKWLELR